MNKVKITVIESKCRGKYCKNGVYALQNGADLDYGKIRSKQFYAKCPDGGRVCIHGEIIDE